MIEQPMIDRLRETFRLHAGWFALLGALGLTVLGILAIQTADGGHTPPTAFHKRQTIWLVLSLVVMSICVLPHPRNLGFASLPIMAFMLLLLAVIILPFMPRSIVPVVNGTRAWIDLKFMRLQPSELTKVAFVLSIAWYLRYGRAHRTFTGMLIPFGFMLLPVALIMKEPDLGSASLFAPTLFAMLVAAGAKLRHLASLAGVAVLGLVLAVGSIYTLPDSMQLLKKYQRDRIDALIRQSFLDDYRHVQDIGYQQFRSKTVTGAGGVAGYGEERSQVILRFNKLPEDHNDMIFAVIVNRWGLFGGIAALLLYGLLITSILIVAANSRDPFARLSSVGFAALVFTQMTINIGMAIGLLPIIGITLPFVSYGGSSMISSYAMIGLVLNFASRRPSIVVQPSFEFERSDPMLTQRWGEVTVR